MPDRRRDDPRERTTSLAFGSARLGWRRMHMHVRWPGARFAKCGAGRGSRARRLPMSRSRRTWTRAARYCGGATARKRRRARLPSSCDEALATRATVECIGAARASGGRLQAIERASTHVDVDELRCCFRRMHGFSRQLAAGCLDVRAAAVRRPFPWDDKRHARRRFSARTPTRVQIRRSALYLVVWPSAHARTQSRGRRATGRLYHAR